jgi:hypothetical protein
MRLQLLFITFIYFIIFCFPLATLAQEDTEITELYRIELKDGSVFIGNIISETDADIRFKTTADIEVSIPKSQIRKKEMVSGQMVRGELWRADPNRTRLFFAPTGRALKAGQGYFSVYQIFFPFIAVGVTDFLAIAGGISLFPGASSQLLYVAPKITPVRVNKFDLSAGVLYIRIPDGDDGDDGDDVNKAGIIYGVGTYGTEKAALTVGIGFGYAGDDVADKPVFAVGGEIRASRKVKFITENWLIPDSEVQIVSFGLRFFGDNLAADFALVYAAGGDVEGFPFLPWIGFAYNFGS